MANVDVELGDADNIQTQNTVQILLDCVENGKTHTNKLAPSIYMVPSVFRDLSPTSFNPRVVSIGPLHRQDKKLQEFEVHKASAVHDLLHRIDCKREETLQSCVHRVNDSIGRIRDCYAEIITCSDVELAKMMVMDACFILDFIYKFSNHRPVVRNRLLQASVICDLLLIENQIPFFVLNDIFQCTILRTGYKAPLSDFIFPVLDALNLFNKNLDKGNISIDTTHDHILGHLHDFYWPQVGNISSDSSSSSNHSAVDLDRAGVSFKPIKNANWSLEMKVESHKTPCIPWSTWAKPTLRMPVLSIHDDTELILRNLMAYEQSSLGCYYVTSYVTIMDTLINTEEDIAMLVESKVLVNDLGSNVEAADMINSICKDVTWIHLYEEQWKKLDSYCNDYWPKHVARLRRTYFSSPWSIIALVAGFLLFGLTVVQTICAILELK